MVGKEELDDHNDNNAVLKEATIEGQKSDDVDGLGSGTTKKISGKELIQHVKNQKKKIAEKESEIVELKLKEMKLRSRALVTVMILVDRKTVEKRIVRAFHKWLAFAEREAAGVEVERVASLAHRASNEVEIIKEKLDATLKEKAELEVGQKKLRILLTKAKQQISDHAKLQEQAPEGFTASDVSRKTCGPEGTVWCLIHTKKNTYEWREEKIVCQWLIAAMMNERAILEKMTIEDELQERYNRSVQELEAAISLKQAEFDALNDRFEQYRHRAELALEKAGSANQSHDEEIEYALKAELAKVAQERDSHAFRYDELKLKLDATESSLATARLRERALKEERDDFEKRAVNAQKALETARSMWEANLVKAELDFENRLRSERNEARAAEQRAEIAEKQFSQALLKEADIKESEKNALEQLSRADDRVEGLRAALARAESKLLEQTKLAQTASNASMINSTHHLVNRPSSSAFSSPRIPLSNKTHELESDSASEVQQHPRLRKDSDLSENSVITEMGSKYFVDQIGALRQNHRNERAEWQRERAGLKAQIDDANKRKELAEERMIEVENKLNELKLAEERRSQLAESARTVSETPDGLLYLKNAVFRFITADDDSERETLLPVITMLLKFSPEEVQVLSKETMQQAPAGVLGNLLAGWRRS